MIERAYSHERIINAADKALRETRYWRAVTQDWWENSRIDNDLWDGTKAYRLYQNASVTDRRRICRLSEPLIANVKGINKGFLSDEYLLVKIIDLENLRKMTEGKEPDFRNQLREFEYYFYSDWINESKREEMIERIKRRIQESRPKERSFGIGIHFNND